MSDQVAVRLQKYLAEAGLASRREAEEHIASGKVYVNGRKATLGQKITPGTDKVSFKGKAVELEERVTFLFHKPRGFLCNDDGRREGHTIFTEFDELKPYRVVIGLGKNASGLILLSNDGDLLQKVNRQLKTFERMFRIRIQSELDEATLAKLDKGVHVDNHRVRPLRIKALKADEGRMWYEVSVNNYRDSMVEKMFKAVQHPVQRIVQMEVAGLRDDLLPKGTGRPLTPKELLKLNTLVGDQPT